MTVAIHDLLRERIPEKLIVILAKELDRESSVLDIQDYVVNGVNVIPLFSSDVAFHESTGGGLQFPPLSINRTLLATILNGKEIFLLDPTLATEVRFTVDDFRTAFPELFHDPT